jgi:hypothetical protein
MNKNPKIENLEPFKKGQSGNPNGRPKGKRSRSTIIKEWLEVEQVVKNPLTGEQEKLQQQDLMTLALVKKARNGDVNAYKELMDGCYGKIPNINNNQNVNVEDMTEEQRIEKLRELKERLNNMDL